MREGHDRNKAASPEDSPSPVFGIVREPHRELGLDFCDCLSPPRLSHRNKCPSAPYICSNIWTHGGEVNLLATTMSASPIHSLATDRDIVMDHKSYWGRKC